jgi:hypothetical protein
MLYIKIGAAVAFLMFLLGIAYYVRSVFQERNSLLGDKAALTFQLATEKQKVVVAMEQLAIWQDTVKKMNEAVKNIKIQSDVYIEGVDDAKKPTFNGNTPIPFILSGMAGLPRTAGGGYENFTSSRKPSAITASGNVPDR